MSEVKETATTSSGRFTRKVIGLTPLQELMIDTFHDYVPSEYSADDILKMFNWEELDETYKWAQQYLDYIEQGVLEHYYFKRLTIQGVSNELGISMWGVRNRLYSACRKLRSPHIKSALKLGLSNAESEWDLQAYETALSGELTKIHNLMDSVPRTDLGLYNLFSEEDLKTLQSKGISTLGELATYVSDSLSKDFGVTLNKFKYDRVEKIGFGTPIELLGLSQRAYSALRRGKVCTVGDLVELGFQGLSRIRNLGAVCIAEIADKCKLGRRCQ